MPAERDEAGDDDEDEDDDLEDAEEVLQAQAPVQREAVDEERESDACEADQAESPAAGLDIRGEEDVFTKDEGVSGGPCWVTLGEIFSMASFQ